MVNEIILYSQDIPAGSPMLRNLWKDEAVFILLNEYKKLKNLYNITRSSSMPKKGWETIKNKLHFSGYTDIRTQHVIKKFASLKLQYKELREGLPVKQKVYTFIDLLSDILDDDPYIEYAKPTKRMKERKNQKRTVRSENFIIEFEDDSGEQITQVFTTIESKPEDLVDASVLLQDDIQQEVEINSKTNRKRKFNLIKDSKTEDDSPDTPPWIQYFVSLLKKEEHQRQQHLWTLHQNIIQTESAKLDILDRLVHSLRKPRIFNKNKNIKKSKLVIPEKTNRNIIIVDEEGSIYLKPDLKRKINSEFTLMPKIIKTETQVEFIDNGEIITEPQFELIGDGDEIIIEQCDDEVFKVEQVYEEVLEDNVISHQVEIVDNQIITENIEFIQQE